MKRILAILLAIAVILPAAPLAAAPSPPAVDAEAACLMVAGTRRVLFDKNMNKIMYPASTTKILSLLTALQYGRPEGVGAVSSRAAATEDSEMVAGDRLTLRDLMYVMMLESDNGAAVAVAETVAGSERGFVELMNREAMRLGARNSHFSNPHGLPDPANHFSTAYDLALIAAAGLRRPDFVEYVSRNAYVATVRNRGTGIRLTNTNRLLGTFSGANGIKTGFTQAAGPCLVASARRGGVQLIAVVLNDGARWEDAAALLEYGFAVAGVNP